MTPKGELDEKPRTLREEEEADLPSVVECLHVPAGKGVVVGVHVGGDEGAPPVDAQPKGLQILLKNRAQ